MSPPELLDVCWHGLTISSLLDTLSMHQRALTRDTLRRLAEEWQQPNRPDGRTFYLTPGEAPPPDLPLPDTATTQIQRSSTGAVVLWAPDEVHLVIPPFPVEKTSRYNGWDVEPLRDLLERQRKVAVLVLRLGGFAVGIYDGEALAQSKVGRRFVKGRHRKGGSSSGRFARRRQEQARALFDKACEVLGQQLDAYPGTLDHFLLAGERETLRAFEKRCARLEGLKGVRLGRTFDVAEPSLKALQALPRTLYQARVLTFGPDDLAESAAE